MTTTLITYIVLGVEISTLLEQQLEAGQVPIMCRAYQCSPSIKLKHGDIVREKGGEGGRREEGGKGRKGEVGRVGMGWDGHERIVDQRI